MATTGIVNGTIIGLYVGGTLVANGTSNDFSLEHSPREATTKDSSGYKEILEGLRSGSFSGDFYFAEDAAYGYEDLYSAWTGRTQLTILYGGTVTGDKTYAGTCYLTSLSRTAPLEESETFSASFDLTGQITQATVV